MSEHWPTDIEIGGEVSRKLRSKLIEVIVDQGCCSEDWTTTWTPESLEKEIQDGCPIGAGVLFLKDSQARYGEFEQLEAFCRQHNIYFDRHSDAHDEYSAENLYFRGGENIIVRTSNQEGVPLVAISELQKILDEAKAERPFDDSYILLKVQEAIDMPDPLVPLTFVHRSLS